MSIVDTLSTLGLVLPPVAAPVASYVPAVRSGSMVYTSGQIPFQDGELRYAGLVGTEISAEEAHAAARICALNCLAALNSVLESLDDIVRIVHVTGYVRSAPDFTGQPGVINGASDLLVQVFGQAGQHSRAAVGVAQLPLGASVEVDLVAEVG